MLEFIYLNFNEHLVKFSKELADCILRFACRVFLRGLCPDVVIRIVFFSGGGVQEQRL